MKYTSVDKIYVIQNKKEIQINRQLELRITNRDLYLFIFLYIIS